MDGVARLTVAQECANTRGRIQKLIGDELEVLKERTGMFPDSINVDVISVRPLGESFTNHTLGNVELTFKY